MNIETYHTNSPFRFVRIDLDKPNAVEYSPEQLEELERKLRKMFGWGRLTTEKNLEDIASIVNRSRQGYEPTVLVYRMEVPKPEDFIRIKEEGEQNEH